MANIPELRVNDIMQVEAEFITVFMYENLNLNQQELCEQMINHSFADKHQYLADRADELIAAREFFSSERKKRLAL